MGGENNNEESVPTKKVSYMSRSVVIPAKAGIQSFIFLDPRLRGDDNKKSPAFVGMTKTVQ